MDDTKNTTKNNAKGKPKETVKVDKKEAVDKLTIVVPNSLSEDELNRLLTLIKSKKTLLCHAFGVKDVPVNCTGKDLVFPWFTPTGEKGEVEAYGYFIEALIKFAKEATRINAEERKEENEKYAMRMFTVRLNLKGDKYKLLRKLLVQNLKGNSAWRNGKPAKQ